MRTKDRPALRIGLLNMMADGALRATERQFTRLIGTAHFPGPVQDLAVFSLPELERSAEARRYIADNYRDFAQVREAGLDALIITGVNLSDPRLEIQPFWEPLQEVMAWARDEVPTTLCSCLATHAVLQFRFGQKRGPLPSKLWGVFPQRVTEPDHPLTRGLPPVVAVPHSRHNDVGLEQFQASELTVLIDDPRAGVHLACDAAMRLVVLQGHPEYDTISLLKEYKREVNYFRAGRRSDYPPVPEAYVDDAGVEILADFQAAVLAEGELAGDFPEAVIQEHLVNAWADWMEIFFANWLAVARVAGV